jgi:hypothetical protein
MGTLGEGRGKGRKGIKEEVTATPACLVADGEDDPEVGADFIQSGALIFLRKLLKRLDNNSIDI